MTREREREKSSSPCLYIWPAGGAASQLRPLSVAAVDVQLLSLFYTEASFFTRLEQQRLYLPPSITQSRRIYEAQNSSRQQTGSENIACFLLCQQHFLPLLSVRLLLLLDGGSHGSRVKVLFLFLKHSQQPKLGLGQTSSMAFWVKRFSMWVWC